MVSATLKAFCSHALLALFVFSVTHVYNLESNKHTEQELKTSAVDHTRAPACHTAVESNYSSTGAESGFPKVEQAARQQQDEDNEAFLLNAFQHLREYAVLHQKIMSDSPDLQPSQKKYLIWTTNPMNGLGNRLQCLVSAFMMAFVTKRALLVDWHPFPPTYWNENEGTVMMCKIQELFENPDFSWDFDEHRSRLEGNPDYARMYTVDLMGFKDLDTLVCKNLDEALPQTFINVFSWDYWGLLISQNLHYRDMIHSVFGRNFFEPFSQFLLRPIPHIRQRVEEFVEDKFRGKYVVALQIRNHAYTFPINGVMDKIVLDYRLMLTYFNCAKQLAVLSGVRPEDVVYFVTSNDKRARDAAPLELGNNVVERPTQFTNFGPVRDTPVGQQEAIMDMWTLMYANVTIVPHGSTFGLVATGTVSRMPWEVEYSLSTCRMCATPQPCFFAWDAIVDSVKCFDKKDYDPATVNMGNKCWTFKPGRPW